MATREQLASPPPRPTISVAINPVALVTSECITVTSAMRKNARWAQSSVSAILGGGGSSTYDWATSGSNTPVPGSPLGPMVARKGGKPTDLGNEVGGLAGRWGLRGKKGKSIQDNPLISAFAKLRGDLQDCKDITTFDTPSLLHPFLQVIKSSSTSGPITSLAIIAITKFFSYNLINRDSPNLAKAMQQLSASITHCRFEASDSAQDDVVLLRILKLMEMMISGPGGDLLGDESVCEMMETGLSMCVQTRLSEVLRKSAEVTMITMCQVVFERLKHLEIEAEEDGADLEADLEDNMDTVKIEHAVNGNDSRLPTANAAERSSGSSEGSPSDRPTIAPEGNGAGAADSEAEPPIRPYSLPSIRELLKVLVQLLDPDDLNHTDTMRVMAMRIIDVAFEVAGPSIAKHPSLAALAKDNLCRYLFQLVKSDVMPILHESLRVTGTLLATTRGVLKLQQELFLSYLLVCLHPSVPIPREPGIDPVLYAGVPQAPKLVKPAPSQSASGRSTPVPVKERQKLGLEGGIRRPDACEAMVECIGALARMPSYMVELYVNYDCAIDRNDLCEDVIGFLSRSAFPDSATWSTTNVPPLCLDALLGYVTFICERLDGAPHYEGLPDPEQLKETRQKKQTIIRGIKKFNESPKKGIAYLLQQGIIDGDNPVSIARFVKSTTRISKKLLGEYVSKKENIEILKEFINQFDFAGKRVDEAVRELLETFRLPGEAQLIERIVSQFAEKYCSAEQNLKDVANQDAVFVLTYAIIMLNTDQHNPNMKNQVRMKYEDFARNLRGVNNGENFDQDYLQLIFDTIKNNEIILPDEHDNKHAFDYAWREMLTKTSTAGDMILCPTNIYDSQMFAATWKPIVATLSYVFMSATDDAVFSRVITGFDQCARIAAKYQVTEALDHIVRCLSIISTLSTESPPSTALNTEVKVHGNSVMVSELAVKFGRDFKAQLATVVLFRIVSGNEGVLKSGWESIVRTWLNLFTNSLIPSFFTPEQSGLDLPPIPLHIPSVVVERPQLPKESGLFSTLSSYLSSYANDDPPEPSEEELDSTLCTVDCINACYLGDIFANLVNLDAESLGPLIAALLEQLPDLDGEEANLVIVKPDYMPADEAGNTKKEHVYDASVVYVLELATCLVLRDAQTLARHGKTLANTLQGVVRNAPRTHHIVVSRAIYYMLFLMERSHELGCLNIPVVLHSLIGLDRVMLNKSAIPIAKGLDKCLKGPSPLKAEIINSPDFWLLVRALVQSKDAVADVFSLLEYITADVESNVTSDNYVAVVGLLNDFATEASMGAVYEQKQDKTAKRGKPAKKLTERPDADIVLRGTTAVTIVYRLTHRVPELIGRSHLERNEAWTTYWAPILQSLSQQATNPCREVRNQALTYLRQSLLSPELTSDDHHEWTAIFGEVLFPLIGRLLKPEVFQSDPKGMSDTRVVVATVLCKIFLHYLVMLSEWEGMLDLWVKILDIMDRLMNSGQGDHLEEAVPESLKNILLVMASGGYLVPPSSDGSGKTELWEQTWYRIDRFLPDMRKELFPDEPQPAPQPATEKPPVPADPAPVETVEPAETAEKPAEAEPVGEKEVEVEEKAVEAPEVEGRRDSVD